MKKFEESILVTVGTGFIGSKIVEKLLSEVYQTHVIDNMSNGNMNFVEKCKKNPNFKFFKLDQIGRASCRERV